MTRLTNLNVRATVLKIFTNLKTCIFRKKKKTTKNKIKKKNFFGGNDGHVSLAGKYTRLDVYEGNWVDNYPRELKAETKIINNEDNKKKNTHTHTHAHTQKNEARKTKQKCLPKRNNERDKQKFY